MIAWVSESSRWISKGKETTTPKSDGSSAVAEDSAGGSTATVG